MIKVVIIEDERVIAAELKKLIQALSPEIEVVASLTNVQESVSYFQNNDSPDLIFSDVQLPDGLSFDIFNRVHLKTPVIFVTAYDNYIVNAFEHNGIDYLLKPVDERDLAKAVGRYKTLQTHFNPQQPFLDTFRSKQKRRMIVRKGVENIALRVEDIVLVYTENKVVYVMDKDGRKYLSDKNLSDIFEQLDSKVFFRANRQYIVNIAFVRSYKTYEKVKLQIDLTMPLSNHHIVVSQETAPDFRKWMSGD